LENAFTLDTAYSNQNVLYDCGVYRKIAWPFSFYFFNFAASAAVLPYVVLYYQELGFSGTQIGLLTGITPLITLVSAPFWTGLADTTRRHRLILGIVLLIGSVILAVLPLLRVFLPVFLLIIGLNLLLGPVNSFSDSASMTMLGEKKELFGRVRLGGTLGYGVFAILSGTIVQNLGLRAAFWVSAGVMFAAFIVSRKLEFSTVESVRVEGGGLHSLLKNPRWIGFLVLAFAGGLSVAGLNSYILPYMGEIGSSELLMGIALAFGTVFEIPVLFFGDRLLKKLKPWRLYTLSLVLSGIRFLLYAANPFPAAVLAIQMLNGLTFPIMWVAGVAYADEIAPEGFRTTAQGIFSAFVVGIGNAVGSFLGGILLPVLGGRGVFLVLGSGILLFLILGTLLHRFYERKSA